MSAISVSAAALACLVVPTEPHAVAGSSNAAVVVDPHFAGACTMHLDAEEAAAEESEASQSRQTRLQGMDSEHCYSVLDAGVFVLPGRPAAGGEISLVKIFNP